MFHSCIGTLVFQPGETEKTIPISIIDDDIYEEDEHFCVRLGNPKYCIDESGK